MSNERGSVRQEGASSKGRRIRSIPLLTLPCIQIEDRPTCICCTGWLRSSKSWHAGLALREEKEHALGELTLGVEMDNQQQMARCPAAMDSEAVTVSFLASLLSLHGCIVVFNINHAIAKRLFLLNLVQHKCGVRGLSIREDLHHKENGINAIFNVLNPFDEHMISLLEEYPNYSVRRPARVLPL
ncbi:hypothetical protein HPB51_008068 [Rhipicephalus microplus]|uniref:Uncharacterized protein n=1 Tax=Rhipicephalus microplus TaxID=6941 RepID=A0A9J6EG04_RHIMP|nr:hypothetical protein HPB51_008068 [Rhipicephalus microplus]